MLLQSVEMKTAPKAFTDFPYSVPFVKTFERLTFRSPITFLLLATGVLNAQEAWTPITPDNAMDLQPLSAVATHSPIFVGVPRRADLSFDGSTMSEVAYDDFGHMTVTRDF